MSFEQLGLSAGLVRAVTDQGYHTPTPIQQQAIPVVLSGEDLMASAQTGTGKTAGFVLPLLERLSQGKHAKPRFPRALVLAPTRELAIQVEDSVRTYGAHLSLKSSAVYGGVGMYPQVKALSRSLDVLVATPGRLLDHINQRNVALSEIEILVLDEADRMLDMGFLPDIRRLLGLMPTQRQSLLFSATLSREIRTLAASLLNHPVTIEVEPQVKDDLKVEQRIITVDRERKSEALLHLFETENWHQALIFTSTKHGADRLSDYLDQAGIDSESLHGGKSQGARLRVLGAFKRGHIRALVATDVAARGIDIDALGHVVNYELPKVPEDYVHRIGRTGRAGAEGVALSLVGGDERGLLKGIEKWLKRQFEHQVLPGFEPQARSYGPPPERGGPRRSSRPSFPRRSEGSRNPRRR